MNLKIHFTTKDTEITKIFSFICMMFGYYKEGEFHWANKQLFYFAVFVFFVVQIRNIG